jgi:hypothetical protein
MIEEWKEIKDYPEYWVSNLGRIKRKAYTKHTTRVRLGKKEDLACKVKEKILSLCIGKKRKPTIESRISVVLYNKNGRKRFYVHRLVGMSFVKGYKKELQINHKDGNPKNNMYTNLEWVTMSENMLHARNVLGQPPGTKGKKIWTEEEKEEIRARSKKLCKNKISVLCIENNTIFESAKDAANFNSVSSQSILRACKNLKFTCNGYHWRVLNESI